ncbi:MAG: T9SS type A sorting domain-containing protein [Melioribacteraceae bacterium]|nr:T9SS type A sorting domain-containing protein [Melioribacteraceae bacterium]
MKYLVLILMINSLSLFGQSYFKIWTDEIAEGGLFGETISLQNNKMLISSRYSWSGPFRSGTAFIYTWNGAEWKKEYKFLNTGLHGDSFGYCTAWNKDTILVSSPVYDFDNDNDAGIVYFYIFNNITNKWEEKFSLKAEDSVNVNGFGASFIKNKDRLIVGAPDTKANSITLSGAVYYFEKKDSTWEQKQRITSLNMEHYEFFGLSLAMNDEYLIISAPNEGEDDFGAVYTYRYENGEWKYESRITVNSPYLEQQFGTKVLLDGDELFISEPAGIAWWNTYSGSVYVYKREDNTWKLKQTIHEKELASSSRFGAGLAKYGDSLFVGAPYSVSVDPNVHTGVVFMYTKQGDDWVREKIFYPEDGDESSFFGEEIEVNENFIAIGAPEYRISGISKGAVYVFPKSATSVEAEKGLNPSEFVLEQNYPNPFNPTTSIEYTIPSNEYVTLKVYDILGNEVATIVNEQKQAGTFEVNFNAGNLSSGLYIYKIQAGTHSQVRKMLLLK